MIRLAAATAVVLLTLFGVAVVWQLREAVVLFLLSLAAAAAIRPLVDYLGQSGWRRFLGLTGTYAAGLTILAAVLVATIGFLLGEVRVAADDFVHIYEHVAEAWPHGNWLEKAIARRLPHPEHLYAALAGRQGITAWELILGSAFSIVGSLVNLVVIVVLSVYWTIDRVHFERLWLSQLDLKQRFAAREIWRSLEAEIGSYFRAEMVQSLIAGLLLWSGYSLLGLRYPTITAVVAALALLLPWLGIPVAVAFLLLLAVPTILLSGYAEATMVVGLALVYTLAVLVVLEVVVEPRLLNRRRYNSLLMALVVIALADTFGVLGLLLGPPLAVAMQVLAEHLVKMRIAPPVRTTPLPAADLDERLAVVRASLAARASPPQDLTSLLDRLSTLVAKARRVAVEKTQEAARATPVTGS